MVKQRKDYKAAIQIYRAKANTGLILPFIIEEDEDIITKEKKRQSNRIESYKDTKAYQEFLEDLYS
jgi:hypothetical protein